MPTFTDVCLPDSDASFYFGVVAPTDTPRDIAARFANDAGRIVDSKELMDKFLNNLGFEQAGDTPEQFAAFLKADCELGAQKVNASGARLD